MSCHSRDGFKATARLAAHLTGADRRDVEKNLHALRGEATGANLPSPTQAQIDDWHAEQVAALDASNLPMNTKDALARALLRARYEQPAPDGRDFYVQRSLLARTRQQELVKNTPGLQDLDPPGSHADQYTLGDDGRPAQVWYASFGSNLYAERFNCYIEGGSPGASTTNYLGSRDRTPSGANIPVALPGTVHYAGESSVWTGGVAFLDTASPGKSLGRAYKITSEQFDDVVFQESNSGEPPTGEKVDLNATIAHGKNSGKGIYGTLVHVGDYQGAPVMTFTSPFSVRDALRGDLVYTPDGTLAKRADRAEAQAQQADLKEREAAAAAAENRPVRRIPSDWPIYTAAPSQAYQDMIGGGLGETFGLTPDQRRTYFAGATGYTAPRPDAPDEAAAA